MAVTPSAKKSRMDGPPNPHLGSMESDFLYHIGYSREEARKLFRDVKVRVVCGIHTRCTCQIRDGFPVSDEESSNFWQLISGSTVASSPSILTSILYISILQEIQVLGLERLGTKASSNLATVVLNTVMGGNSILKSLTHNTVNTHTYIHTHSL